MPINLYQNLNQNFIYYWLYSTLKNAYLGPSVDLARDNVGLLLAPMEEIVPTIPSLVQLAQEVTEVDVDKFLCEAPVDRQGEIIATQLGTVCTKGPIFRGINGRVPSRSNVFTPHIGKAFEEQHTALYVAKINRSIRAAASQDPHVRRVPSQCATIEEKNFVEKYRRDRAKLVRTEVEKVVKSLSGDYRGGVEHVWCTQLTIYFVCGAAYRWQPPLLQGSNPAMGTSSGEGGQ